MKYGIVLTYGDAREAADLAREAEQAGWDGFFVWEPIWGIDAWVALTAAAMLTTTIRLGTMLTPLPIRKPWKLASEAATLDRLSGGRVILSVGLGAADTGFASFGEPTDRKTRAELLDEGLDVLTGLWHGQPCAYQRRHYRIDPTGFFPPPPPIQQPRIPIWVVGAWPRMKSIRRALKCDGVLPVKLDAGGQMGALTPAEVAEARAYIEANRASDAPFDIVIEGSTAGLTPEERRARLDAWEQAGATWWVEGLWGASFEEAAARIREGLLRIKS